MLIVIAALKAPENGWRWLVRPATFSAAVGVAAFQLFFFSGVDRTGVAVGTLLALGSAAVFVGVFEAVVVRTWPRRSWVVATIPAIIGLAILSVSTGDVTVDGMGVILALLAGLSYALYVVSAARLARMGSVRHSSAALFGLASVMLLPVVLTQDLSFVRSVGGAVMVLWLGFATLAVAYLLFIAGLRTTDSSSAATLTLAEPVTAAVLGVVVLAERPGVGAWIGIALIIVGLALAARSSLAEVPVVPA